MIKDTCENSGSSGNTQAEIRKTLISLLGQIEGEKLDKQDSSSFEVLQSASSSDGTNLQLVSAETQLH